MDGAGALPGRLCLRLAERKDARSPVHVLAVEPAVGRLDRMLLLAPLADARPTTGALIDHRRAAEAAHYSNNGWR